jgi:hypothetical protein
MEALLGALLLKVLALYFRLSWTYFPVTNALAYSPTVNHKERFRNIDISSKCDKTFFNIWCTTQLATVCVSHLLIFILT